MLKKKQEEIFLYGILISNWHNGSKFRTTDRNEDKIFAIHKIDNTNKNEWKQRPFTVGAFNPFDPRNQYTGMSIFSHIPKPV